MVVSHFQIGTVPELHYLKIRQILHLTLSPGSNGSCSPIVTYKVIAMSIAIPFFHVFYLAFAASKNLFITRENSEDDIIMFARLQFVERKCQLLNTNVNR